eukprot:5035950-Amphidinium_carterae.1
MKSARTFAIHITRGRTTTRSRQDDVLRCPSGLAKIVSDSLWVEVVGCRFTTVDDEDKVGSEVPGIRGKAEPVG